VIFRNAKDRFVAFTPEARESGNQRPVVVGVVIINVTVTYSPTGTVVPSISRYIGIMLCRRYAFVPRDIEVIRSPGCSRLPFLSRLRRFHYISELQPLFKFNKEKHPERPPPIEFFPNRIEDLSLSSSSRSLGEITTANGVLTDVGKVAR
jgi:hypothetical protein